MTATKIQPGDDTHLTSLMAPHSLNFVTGADRAALLAYGRDVFSAARASQCLAKIEEPAAPAAVAPQGEYPPLPDPDSYLFQHEETGLTQYVDAQQVDWGFEKNNPRWKKCDGVFSESQLRAYFDLGRQAAPALEAPAAPAPAVPDGFALVPLRRLKNARALVDRGFRTEGSKILDELIAATPVLAAAPQAPAKGLPYEPTSDMLNAGRACDPALPFDTVRAIWWSMWRTAPQAPAAPDLRRENVNLHEALAWWRRDAKIRGDAVRLLMENLSDEDRLGDGRINTTRVRELLEPITRDTDEQSRDLDDSPAEAAPAAPAMPYTHVTPDCEDAGLLWAEIHHLRAAVQGPDGFASWQEAATAERAKRVAAERAAAGIPAVHTPWLPYLSDRADGVKGRYAIARHNPAGYREVWNLRRHCWSAFSDEVLTMDEALAILQKLTMPTAAPAAPAVDAAIAAKE